MSAFLPIIYLLIGIITAISIFIWRSAITFLENSKTYATLAFTFKIPTGIFIGIFLLGLPFIEFQNETQGAIDIVWECGLFNAGTIADSFIFYPISYLWTNLTPPFNNIILIVREFVITQFNDIVSSFEISQIENAKEALNEAYDYYYSTRVRYEYDFYESHSLTFPPITQIFYQAMEILVTFLNIIAVLLSETLTFTIVTQDTNFCLYQAPLLPNRCILMQIATQGTVPTCSDPHDVVRDIVSFTYSIFDLLSFDLITDYWDNLIDPSVGMIAAYAKRPMFLANAILDAILADIIPGHVACMNIDQAGTFIEDWALDLSESTILFIEALTDGQLTNFFEFIFAAIFGFIQEIINLITAVINCIETYTPCGADFLGCLNRVLAGALDQVVQFFSNAITSVEEVANEAHGIVNCIGGECASEICFQISIPVINLEITVFCSPNHHQNGCSFFQYLACLPNCFTNHAACCVDRGHDNNGNYEMTCTGDRKRNNNQEPYGSYQDMIHQMTNGSVYGGKNYTVEGALLESWHLMLIENGIDSTSTCGSILFSSHPTTMYSSTWSNALLYMGCLRINVPKPSYHSTGSTKRTIGNIIKRFYTPPQAFRGMGHNESYTVHEIGKFVSNLEVRAINALNSIRDSPYFKVIKKWTSHSLKVYEKYGIEDKAHFDLLLNKEMSKYGLEHPGLIDSTDAALAIYQNSVSQLGSYGIVTQEKHLSILVTKELSTLYVTFMNDMIDTYLGNTTQISRKKLEARDLINAMDVKLNIPAYGFAMQLYKRGNLSKTKNFMATLIDVINKRYGFEYWPMYQKLHLVSKTFNGDFNRTQVNNWMKGDAQYLVTEGFVSKMEYDMAMERNAKYVKSTFYEMATGNFTVRSYPYITGPFLTKNTTYNLPKMVDIVEVIGQKHRDRMNNPTMSKPLHMKQSGLSVNTNFNTLYLQMIDWILSFITTVVVDFVQGVENIIRFFEDLDYKGFFENTVKNFFQELVNCHIPQNIEGDLIYNPFCFPLLPEAQYNWVILTPNPVWPLQIPWPQGLIQVNCTNTFNGNSQPLEFSLYDNCGFMDGQPRPLCPTCSYCSRTYNQCNDLGFLDFIDTILFILGLMPSFINFFFSEGIPLQVALNWCIGITTLIVGIVLAPTFLNPAFPITILIFIIDLLIPMEVYYLFFWICQFFFVQLNYGTIICFLVIVGIIAAAYFGILVIVIQKFPVIIIILSIYILLYIILQFLSLPPDTWSPTNTIVVVLTYFNDSWIFVNFPRLNGMIARAQRFNYGSNAPPALDYICSVFTMSNSGLAPVAVFSSLYVVTFAVRQGYVVYLFILDLISLIGLTISAFTANDLSEQMGFLKNKVSDLKRKQQNLKTKFKTGLTHIKNNISESIAIDMPSGSPVYYYPPEENFGHIDPSYQYSSIQIPDERVSYDLNLRRPRLLENSDEN